MAAIWMHGMRGPEQGIYIYIHTKTCDFKGSIILGVYVPRSSPKLLNRREHSRLYRTYLMY